MSAPRTPLPSPSRSRVDPTSATLSAELGQARVRAGEGAFAGNPSPGRSLRSRPPSPARGEGTEPAARAEGPATPMSRRSLRTPTSHARALRARMTDAEAKLWFALRDRGFANFKFRRQAPVGPFIADFVCYDVRVVVEVDGGQHAELRRDERRDRWFAANDFLILRFWNNDVLTNLAGVLTSILEILSQRTPHPDRAPRGRPSPAGGEGDGVRCAGGDKDLAR